MYKTRNRDQLKENESHTKRKNEKIKILQYMYHGDKDTPLHCLESKEPAFVEYKCKVTGEKIVRCVIEWNHMRQKSAYAGQFGKSVDKGKIAPATILRRSEFDIVSLVEFMTIGPLSILEHNIISDSSRYGDVTLSTFKKKNWPWHLKCKRNFDKFCKDNKISFLDYESFIDHMTDIDAPPIRDRIVNTANGYKFLPKHKVKKQTKKTRNTQFNELFC